MLEFLPTLTFCDPPNINTSFKSELCADRAIEKDFCRHEHPFQRLRVHMLSERLGPGPLLPPVSAGSPKCPRL